jgi:hypothetical protein
MLGLLFYWLYAVIAQPSLNATQEFFKTETSRSKHRPQNIKKPELARVRRLDGKSFSRQKKP